jgi:hypothetical protein
MKRVTLNALRKQYPTVTFNDNGHEITASAPAGHNLDGDLHEYIAEYRSRRETYRTKQEALDDLAQRMSFAKVQPCKAHAEHACDWCESVLGETA